MRLKLFIGCFVVFKNLGVKIVIKSLTVYYVY